MKKLSLGGWTFYIGGEESNLILLDVYIWGKILKIAIKNLGEL